MKEMTLMCGLFQQREDWLRFGRRAGACSLHVPTGGKGIEKEDFSAPLNKVMKLLLAFYILITISEKSLVLHLI